MNPARPLTVAERHRKAWLLANALGFQLVWWVLILYGPESPALAVTVLVAWASAHLWLSPCRGLDLRLMLLLAAVGPWLDVGIEAAGWLHYHGVRVVEGWATVWIVGLWAAFALTVNHSLRGILAHRLLALGFGGLGGALAYAAGTRFGAGTLPPEPVGALLGIGAVWAAVLALLSRWLGRRQSPVEAPR